MPIINCYCVVDCKHGAANGVIIMKTIEKVAREA